MERVKNQQFSRTEKLIGKGNLEKLNNSHIAVFGIGGVGTYATEALVRSGVGKITVVDDDIVSQTNINRQLIALHSTVGQSKTAVIKKRILDINPFITVNEKKLFFSTDTLPEFDFSEYDFVLDCIDSVESKILLIKTCKKNNINIISSMGTGNKIMPEKLIIDDIKNTSYCPLARKVRSLLKKEGIDHLTVVYSKEEPIKKEGVPASIAFVPSVAGLLMASFVVREIIK